MRVDPWRVSRRECDESECACEEHDGRFGLFRGLLFGLPISALLWLGLYALWRAFAR